jgi:hypothetical protein
MIAAMKMVRILVEALAADETYTAMSRSNSRNERVHRH